MTFYDCTIPMAHCGICNSSYPAQHYHQCCGQVPLPPKPVVPALDALGEIVKHLAPLDKADREWLIARLRAMDNDAPPLAPKCGEEHTVLGADGVVRPVMSWAERVAEAEARPPPEDGCDPECVHCAAWRVSGTGRRGGLDRVPEG